jgi:hypothetical protein
MEEDSMRDVSNGEIEVYGRKEHPREKMIESRKDIE